MRGSFSRKTSRGPTRNTSYFSSTLGACRVLALLLILFLAGFSFPYFTSFILEGNGSDWSHSQDKEQELSAVTVELNRTLQLLSAALAVEEAEVTRCSLLSADKDKKLRERSEEMKKMEVDSRAASVAALAKQCDSEQSVKSAVATASLCLEEQKKEQKKEHIGMEWRPFPHVPALRPLDTIHASTFCGTWQQKQKEAGSAAGRRQRWITFRCDPGGCGSVGERMAGMVSVFTVSLLLERGFLCQAEGTEDALSPVEGAVDWRITADMNVKMGPEKEASRAAFGIPDTAHTQKVESGDVALLKLSGVEKQSPRKVYEAFATLAEADNIVVTWRHGITTWMVETRGTPWGARLRHMGLRQPYAFSCLLRYLVRPVDRVVQAVKGQLGEVMEGTDGGGGFSVCLSVNPTHEIASDAAAAQASDSVKRIFHCAEKLTQFWAPTPSTVRWILFSSSDNFRDETQRRYANRVHLANFSSLEDPPLLRQVAEWVLSSQCSLFVFQDEPSPKTASLYSMKPMSAWMFPPHPHPHSHSPPFHQDCHPETPSSIMHLATAGSGA